MLKRRKRTETNESELRRTNCAYPLRHPRERAFKQAFMSGNVAGKISGWPRKLLNRLSNSTELGSLSGTKS